MKNILVSFVTFMLTAAVLASSCVAGQSETEVRQMLAKSFPGITVGEIRGSDIPGLYEVEAGSNIIYFYPEKGLLMFGEIWTKDALGYNFKFALDIAEHPAFPVAGRSCRIIVKMVPASGPVIVVRFRVHVI